ncbi:MAG TPA: phosphonate ABC transporter ATP-binding protein [Symbiobacteriaceae bacterium]|nr:phosphonate ABC transporter ATP-binding protein [Symbiobacteriaceae bacterium]
MITLTNVTKTYRPDKQPALHNASLTIAKGELVALLGPSGAGKSTLLRSINGLVRPESGTINVAGQTINDLSGRDLQTIRRQIAMIFQEFHLIDRLPVLRNVLTGRLGGYSFWRATLGLWRAPDLADARDWLSRVGLQGYEKHLARELSGGQRQRVAIARAMMQRPAVLLGDEPVSSLDPVTAESIMSLLADLTREAGLTTVLSLHDLTLARKFCPRAVGVSGGRIVYDGPMGGLTAEIISQIYAGGETVAAVAASYE